MDAWPLPLGPGGAGVGDVWSDEVGELGEAPSFCFLIASAWRFGGPRRRLGLS